MKKMLLVFAAMFITVAASAQYADNYDGAANHVLSSRGSRIFMDGYRLEKNEAAACFSNLHGYDRSSDYLKYRAAYKAGVGLSVGGPVLFAVSGFTYLMTAATALVTAPFAGLADENIIEEFKEPLVVSFCMTLVGAAATLTGIPLACVYRSRIKDMTSSYNRQHSHPVALSFGAQPSGIGVGLRF